MEGIHGKLPLYPLKHARQREREREMEGIHGKLPLYPLEMTQR
jgi:hypothetical protein